METENSITGFALLLVACSRRSCPTSTSGSWIVAGGLFKEARGTVLIRYADDFVVMCHTEEKAKAAKEAAEAILNGLKLKLNPDKTRVVNPSRKGETVTFLGCTHKKARSRVNGKKFYLYRWPSARSVSRIRERVRERTDPRKNRERIHEKFWRNFARSCWDGRRTFAPEMPR